MRAVYGLVCLALMAASALADSAGHASPTISPSVSTHSSSNTGSSQSSYMTDAKIEILRAGQEAVLNDDFAALDSLHQEFQSQFPNDPSHFLIIVAAQMARMSYHESSTGGESFIALTDEMYSQTTARVDTATADARPWYFMIIGHARLYRSLYEARFGSKFVAMRHGFGAMEYYQKGFQSDSTNIDLLLGMGSFRYWKSTKAGILRTFGLVRNERQLGYQNLIHVAEHSLMSRGSALSAMVYVYIDMDSLKEAHTLAQQLMQEFPKGRSMKWAMGDVLMKMDSTKAARSLYQSLRNELVLQQNNTFNIISCDASIAKTLMIEGAKRDASRHAQVSLATYKELSKEVRRRQSARLEQMRDIADGIQITAVAMPIVK